MNTRSLRFRLVAWYAGLLTAAFVLLSVAMHFGLRYYLERNLRETQSRRAGQIMATLLNRVPQAGEAFVVEEIKARFAPEFNDRFIRITRAGGSVLYASGRPSSQSFDPTKLPVLSVAVPREFARKEELPDRQWLLVVAAPFTATNGARFVVEAGAPDASVRTALRQALLALACGLPVVLLVGVGGGWFLVSRALAPVEEIRRSAEQITLRNLSGRLPVASTGDELERLSIALNHMITRLDEAFQHNRRFMADASHELRTPLTVIRGELEAVVQNPQLAPELRDSIGSVLEEVERLAKIVESLFALSRLDAGEAQAEWVRLDLAKLAATTAEQMCLLAEDKGISIACESSQPVMVQGDSGRLKQVIVNLLDNAIKFTPAGGGVVIRTSACNGTATLDVADTGMGMPASAIPRVFERFFRADEARSREKGGAGIGLSIVKAIVTAHGGNITVESEPSKGTCFHIQLPRTSRVSGLDSENSLS